MKSKYVCAVLRCVGFLAHMVIKILFSLSFSIIQIILQWAINGRKNGKKIIPNWKQNRIQWHKQRSSMWAGWPGKRKTLFYLNSLSIVKQSSLFNLNEIKMNNENIQRAHVTRFDAWMIIWICANAKREHGTSLCLSFMVNWYIKHWENMKMEHGTWKWKLNNEFNRIENVNLNVDGGKLVLVDFEW